MYQRAGGAKNEKSISEAARLLDRWEYTMNTLKKSSDLWHSSSGHKVRPRIGAFLY